ncbi:hypothetical protein QTP88_014515 [Uroleucon formosanum]
MFVYLVQSILYQKEIVSEFLTYFDNNDFSKVTILTAITQINHKTWNNVTAQTIRNYFRMCEFVKAIDKEKDEVFATLEVNNKQLSTFEDLIAIGNELAVYGSINDNDILNKADNEEGNDEGECFEESSVIRNLQGSKIRSPRFLKLFTKT